MRYVVLVCWLLTGMRYVALVSWKLTRVRFVPPVGVQLQDWLSQAVSIMYASVSWCR